MIETLAILFVVTIVLFNMFVYALATNNLSYVLLTSGLFALYIIVYIIRIVKN